MDFPQSKDMRRKHKFENSKDHFKKHPDKPKLKKCSDTKICNRAAPVFFGNTKFLENDDYIYGIDVRHHLQTITSIMFEYDETKKKYFLKETLANNICDNNEDEDEEEEEEEEEEENIEFDNQTTINCAYTCHQKYPQKKICILNFASAKNPGGGFLHGSMAQEESICYVSTLYHSIKHNEMYEINRNDPKGGLYNHIAIYTPKALIFKLHRDDETILPDPFYVSVISCPAVNKGVAITNNISNDRILRTLEDRIRLILHIAFTYEPDILILGAFGCGVFQNNILDVAALFKDILEEYSFPKVIFSIPDKDTLDQFSSYFN